GASTPGSGRCQRRNRPRTRTALRCQRDRAHRRHDRANLSPPRRGRGRRPTRRLPTRAGKHESAPFRAASDAVALTGGRPRERDMRRLRRASDRHCELRRRRTAVHAASDLLARPAREAGVPGGSPIRRRHANSPRRTRRCADRRISDDIVIDVRGLTKSYGGRKVVDNFDLQVPRGAIYGFLGPNGSGKTTTIRMVCGLLKPERGEGEVLGFDVLRESLKIKQRVGYMTQKFSLYEDLSIRE